MGDVVIERVLVWFSCGVTSAVAAKLAVKQYGDQYPIEVCFCDTRAEDDDSYRFLSDVSDWIGLPIKTLISTKYTNTIDVYLKTGWLVGPAGARCSLELKKKVRQDYERLATDLQVWGFDADERQRFIRFQKNNPLARSVAPLIDAGITKREAREILLRAGIQEPIAYSQGFKNNNCLKTGCVKGQMGYWNHYRKVYPERYEQMAQIERKIGAAICKTYAGDGERKPVYLDELDPNVGRYDGEPAIQCGLFCGVV